MPRYRACLATLVTSLLLASGCTAGPPSSDHGAAAGPPAKPQPRTALPAQATVVATGERAADLALAVSTALYQQAPAVVLAGDGDDASMARASDAAVALGVPLLLTPVVGPSPEPGDTSPEAQLRGELTRLSTKTLVTVGDAATAWARTESTPANGASKGTGITVVADSADGAVLPAVMPAAPLADLLVLAVDQPASRAARATAKASGARILLLANPDPRTSDAAIKDLSSHPTAHVLALGSAFGPVDQLRRRIDTAATGVQLPGGGQVVFPGRRMVALYGHPGNNILGSLGEQPLDATVARAKQTAAAYASLVDTPVVPAFEIIATIAASGPGPDGDYSSESSVDFLRPWVDAARDNGIYVVLDLQPGRTDFLTQAKLYTELLLRPNVGLALDPEWRLKPNQVHMEQIGSVSAGEINQTAQWLAALTREHKLPQKVLLLHQFRLDMITDRQTLQTNFDELRIVIHADGFGSPGQKFNTWNTLHLGEPPNVVWGWKNFYDEDKPTFTPQETVAVNPSPVFVSYQ